MSAPSLPNGFDETRHVQAGRPDCHVTLGFDQQGTHIPCFLVQLHYQVATGPVQWEEIARMDHNETSTMGHDVYSGGLHVDVARRSKGTVHLQLSHARLPSNRGKVIRGCAEYLLRHVDYFIDVYEERHHPGGPPRWRPDGGRTARGFISLNRIEPDMTQESPADDALTLAELSEDLAEATGTTAEAIEEGAAELEIASPADATVVDE